LIEHMKREAGLLSTLVLYFNEFNKDEVAILCPAGFTIRSVLTCLGLIISSGPILPSVRGRARGDEGEVCRWEVNVFAAQLLLSLFAARNPKARLAIRQSPVISLVLLPLIIAWND